MLDSLHQSGGVVEGWERLMSALKKQTAKTQRTQSFNSNSQFGKWVDKEGKQGNYYDA